MESFLFIEFLFFSTLYFLEILKITNFNFALKNIYKFCLEKLHPNIQ